MWSHFLNVVVWEGVCCHAKRWSVQRWAVGLRSEAASSEAVNLQGRFFITLWRHRQNRERQRISKSTEQTCCDSLGLLPPGHRGLCSASTAPSFYVPVPACEVTPYTHCTVCGSSWSALEMPSALIHLRAASHLPLPIRNSVLARAGYVPIAADELSGFSLREDCG